MSGMTVKRTNNTHIQVETQGSQNRLTVDLLLWFAREAQKAVDAGMPLDTEVRVQGEFQKRLVANAVLSQEIP
jgi:hypothetical protein